MGIARDGSGITMTSVDVEGRGMKLSPRMGDSGLAGGAAIEGVGIAIVGMIDILLSAETAEVGVVATMDIRL